MPSGPDAMPAPERSPGADLGRPPALRPSAAHPERWPKRLRELTDDQRRIKDDFMRHWLEVLPRRYGAVERFNQTYTIRRFEAMLAEQPANRPVRTLEIGCGLGEHIEYEDLERQEYHAVELRPGLVDRVRERFPGVRTYVGDAQEHIPLDDASVDRVQAIHVLEHMPDLPAALAEVQRVLRPGGMFSVVIPCEGGLAYGLARRISAQRIFERRYRQSYRWFIESEHVNRPAEIIAELDHRFRRVGSSFWPLRVPIVTVNLVIGLTYIRDR